MTDPDQTLLGNPPYESLKGRSLYDLIQKKVDEAERLKTELAQTKELMLFAHENKVREKNSLIARLADVLDFEHDLHGSRAAAMRTCSKCALIWEAREATRVGVSPSPIAKANIILE